MLFRTMVLACISSLSIFAMEPLVNSQWLQQHHNDKNLIIFDVSDAKDFNQGHIEGSINAPISLWREKHKNFLLVTNPASMQKNLQRFGVNTNSKVVIYSHHTNGKDTLKASYVIWAMEYYGFKETAILDGGLPAWKKIKGKISTQTVRPQKGDFIININKNLVANLKDVKKNIAQAQMLDARPAVYYFGAQKQSVLKRAGHVEGARSYFWKYSFDNGLLKDKKTLKSMLVDGLGFDPKKPTITYCTGGLETSMNFFVLHRILGFDNIRLYDASMKEWANKTDTPMRKYQWQ